MFHVHDRKSNITEEEASALIKECQEALKSGRTIEELIQKYREKYSMPEVFSILMHARLRNNIEPKFHDYKGNIRNR